MEILKWSFLCVIVLLPLVLLKKYAAEQAILLVIAAAIPVVIHLISQLAPLIRSLGGLLSGAGIEGEHLEILLRTLAAQLITHLCADLCRDGGSQMLATLVEYVGSVAVFLIAMPLLEAVSQLLLGYFY